MANFDEYVSYPSVAELLQLSVLQDCVLRAGQDGLSNRISGFNLSDTPEYQKWLQPSEILITSCFAIHQSPEALLQFIPTLAQKGISAVFLKPHQYLRLIPDYMIDQANQHHIPLIELSPDVRFSAITKDISDEIIKRHTHTLTNVISVNKVLTEIIINGAGLDEIARMVSDLTGNSVLIMDTVNNRQAFCIADADRETFTGLTQTNQIQSLIEGSQSHEISIDNTLFGYLYLYGANAYSVLEPKILYQILHTIPLEITREQSIHATRNDSLSNFILHLLSDRLIDEAWENTRAEKLGFTVDEMHTVIRMRVEHRQGYDSNICSFQHSLLFINIKSFFVNLGFRIQIVNTAAEYIILLSSPRQNTNLTNLARQFGILSQSFRSAYTALQVKAGIGRTHMGISGMIQGNREAQIAFQAACQGSQDLLSFDSLGILRFIYSDNPRYEINSFIQETLGELTDTGQSRNAELLDTLECYLNNQGNLKRVSEELFTHYNTISYRLKNIQKLLGADLHNADDRFQLQLALSLFHNTQDTELSTQNQNEPGAIS